MNHSDYRSKSWWDREYSPTLQVADAAGYLRAYRAQGHALRRRRPEREVVTYGSTATERFEVFRASSSPGPAVVFVHGGGWHSLSLEDSAFLAPGLLARGVSTIVVDYGLAPAHTLDTIAAMVSHALGRILSSAGELGIDPHQTVVVGTSAGAHLVAMALGCNSHDGGLARAGLAGAVLLSGIYDLEPLRATYYAELLALDQARIARCSPARTGGRPPTEVMLAVGADEGEEFRRQTGLMWEHLHGLSTTVTVREVVGRNHFDLPYDVAQPNTAVGAEVARMLTAGSPRDDIGQDRA